MNPTPFELGLACGLITFISVILITWVALYILGD